MVWWVCALTYYKKYIVSFFKDIFLSFDFGLEHLLGPFDEFFFELHLEIVFRFLSDLEGAVNFGDDIRLFTCKMAALRITKSITMVLP